MRKVLKPYRGWPDPEPGSRWGSWVEAIEKDPSVVATTSSDELYMDSYERYAGKCPVAMSQPGPSGSLHIAKEKNRQPAGH